MDTTRPYRAFTLVEALITVAVVGTLAAIATLVTSNVVGSAREQRLASDIDTLNRAIAAYQASGGDLSGIQDPQVVVERLKQGVSEASRHPGFSGGKIDERLTVVLQSQGEAARKATRAYWNPAAGRFVLSERGTEPGIKSFDLAEAAPNPNSPPGTRQSNAAFLYAENGAWIWDYAEGVAPPPAGPTEVPLGSPDDSPPPPATPTPSGGATPLLPPTFSLAGGGYPIASFNLTLSLGNPNPAGVSELFYSVDFGNWRPYVGPIHVAPGSIVAAQAIATSELHTHSPKVDETYAAIPADLLPPVITPSRGEFGLFTDRVLSVTLLDLNSPGISKLEYRIGGDPWQVYTDPFSVSRDDYPSGVLVQARAVPTDPNYLASTASLRSLGVEEPVIGGSATGSFSNPSGERNMVTNLASGQSSTYFEWGRDYWTDSELRSFSGTPPHLSKSWLDFQGLSFSDVTEGERFQIGRLTYFNGSIVSGTSAERVSFQADMAFSMSGASAKASLGFDFELINVLNKFDPNDPWADADFVRLANPLSKQTISFNGLEYQFILEFGQSTSGGFALFDEFHVLEDQRATTNVYGTLVQAGTISFNR